MQRDFDRVLSLTDDKSKDRLSAMTRLQAVVCFSKMSGLGPRPTQPHIQWAPRALSPGVRQQGHDAEHAPPCSSKGKNKLIYTFTPTCLNSMHRDNLTFIHSSVHLPHQFSYTLMTAFFIPHLSALPVSQYTQH